MNEGKSDSAPGLVLKRKEKRLEQNLGRERGTVTWMTHRIKKGIHPLNKTENQQTSLNAQKNPPYSTLEKQLRCRVGACKHRVGFLSFKEN